MTDLLVENKKDTGLLHSFSVIEADSSTKELPTRIMLIQEGDWPESIKGPLKITASDLQEFKSNFEAGIGVPGNGKAGLPIDFSHESAKKAGAWIKGMEIGPAEDPILAARGVQALYGNPVEWTGAGEAEVKAGNFKCISPSFYPATRGGWTDPQNLNRKVGNVICGAGLTNIPFFQGLSPIMASTLSEVDDDDNMIFINKSESAKEEKPAMTLVLADVVNKDADKITKDEEQFLADHKAELNNEQLTKFSLKKDEAAVTADAQVTGISDADAKILADIKAGNVKLVNSEDAVISASELAGLKETTEQYRKEKAQEIVTSHVKRGAIKADQTDRWTSRLLNASSADRVELEADLTALPSNEVLASAELGDGTDVAIKDDARAEIASRAGKLVEAARAEGKELDYVDAQKQVLASNPDLAEADRLANKIN